MFINVLMWLEGIADDLILSLSKKLNITFHIISNVFKRIDVVGRNS